MAFHYLSSSLRKLFNSGSDYEFLESHDAEKIKRKLSRGYDINQPITWKFHDYETIRPIHLVCARGSPRGCQTVLDYSASVDDQTDSGLFPIHFCVMHRKVENIEVLMNNSADTNVQDAKGNTPLHYAVQEKNLGAVKKLVKDHNADANLKNLQGISPLDMANSIPNKTIFKALNDIISEKVSVKSLLANQEVLGKKVKKINSKVKNMKNQMKKQICEEVKQEMDDEFGRIRASLMTAQRFRGSYPESGYNSQRSLTGTGCLQGNVPSLITHFEVLSSQSTLALPSVTEIPGDTVAVDTHVEVFTGDITSGSEGEKSSFSDSDDFQEQEEVAMKGELEVMKYQLQRNFCDLANFMKAGPITSYLYQEAVIELWEKEKLDTLKTNVEKCEYIVKDVLMKGPIEHIRSFLRGLEETGQLHLAEKIRNTSTSAFYTRNSSALRGFYSGTPPSCTQSMPVLYLIPFSPKK